MTPPQHSMHQGVTPYKSIDDVFALRDAFFVQKFLPAALERAVRTVHLWHTKGAVPHGINMTALIISIQLNDPRYNPAASVSRSNIYTLRAAYAESIITLVNGLLDPFQGDVALPISFMAAKIGLPNYFVEFRHAATHDVLPQLDTLRYLGEKALAWLEHHFWTDDNLLQTPSVAIEVSVRRSAAKVSSSECVQLIKSYKGNRKRGLDTEPVVTQLVAMSRDPAQYNVLEKLILNSKVLFSNSGSFAKLKSFYLPLLDAFPDAFIVHLLIGVLSRCFENHNLSANIECVHSWLGHFFGRLPELAYPVTSLHTFASADEITQYLEKYLGLLSSDSASFLKDLLSGKPSRTLRAAPSLADVLGGTEAAPAPIIRSPPGSPDREKRQRQNPIIFGSFSAWKPVPFGVYPES